MSLLFDALNRAQDNGNRVQDKDAEPLHLPSDNNDAAQAEGVASARSLLSAGNKPQTHILPYAAGGLALLIGVAAWFFYQQNQISSIAPLPAVAGVASIKPTLAASSVVGTEANAQPGTTKQLALSDTLAGADAPTGAGISTNEPASPVKTAKPATRPAKASSKHAKQRTAGHKSAGRNIMASTSNDPLQEAYLALSAGRLDLAEQKYLAALAQHPHEKDALLGLAVIAQRKLQTQRATDLYQQVLREDLGNVTAAAGLVSLSVQADPVAAESQLRQLLDIRPNAPEFHHALGNVLASQLRWGEAQQAFFRAHSLAPGNALYAYNLAVALEHLHQPSAALPYYEKAFQLAGTSSTTVDRAAIQRRIQTLSQTTQGLH